ncbi:hypothetical protein C7974DRAFT_407310 [Boeremia exigua]|uniref:uncharacterized protein n=1 Tax=Boeremia exigua TaxID=749465 RepID=UPI001E8E0543|nr:uncharacterized protein C7974DRAFT_407310 [Boeremia exigua]KAH6643578.1 hypothetical protein C7974DRAFT_407310 [Boeremia exigua]
MPSATLNPRQRLSILTNASFGHDVSAAFTVKAAASPSQQRSIVYGETAAPPPSPIDFSFPSTPKEKQGDERGAGFFGSTVLRFL